MNDKHCEFQAVGHSNLVENTVEVVLDGLLLNGKLFRNVAVGHPFHDRLGNLQLTERQTKAVSRRDRRILEDFNQLRHTIVTDPEFAARDAANASQDKVTICVLSENTADT